MKKEYSKYLYSFLFIWGILTLNIFSSQEAQKTLLINTNLTNSTVNAYSANFKFFILTLRNGESIQMLACDYDGKLQEKYDNIKVINERKGD